MRYEALPGRLVAVDVEGNARALLKGAWITAHNARADYAVLSRHLPDGSQPG